MPARLNKKSTLAQLGEFGFIEWIKKNTTVSGSVIKGIGDDAAVIALTEKKRILLTTDMLLEDVHFTLKMPIGKIGYKAIAVNISDIAAMGGVPKYILVSLGVPARTRARWIFDLYQAMHQTALKFGTCLVGGDTIRSDKTIINIAMMGESQKDKIIFRSGARPQDKIFVTGKLGNSFKSGRHLSFTPRVKESQYLVKYFKPTAMIDVSDGLLGDLGHILQESHVSAILNENKIPRQPSATLENALYDGEDFELLFTLSALDSQRLRKIKTPFSFYPIGEIIKGTGQIFLRNEKEVLRNYCPKSYTHF